MIQYKLSVHFHFHWKIAVTNYIMWYITANDRSLELFGKRVFCQKHETRQELGNKAGNIINWRNNDQTCPTPE